MKSLTKDLKNKRHLDNNFNLKAAIRDLHAIIDISKCKHFYSQTNQFIYLVENLLVMRFLYLFCLFFISVSSYSQDSSDNDPFFVIYFNVAQKEESESDCFTATGGGQTRVLQSTIASELRRKYVEQKLASLDGSDKAKWEYSYITLRKNQWAVVIEHQIKAKDCKDGIRKKRELIKFETNERPSQSKIDKKVTSTVYYLMNKKDKYIEHKTLQVFQPITDENKSLFQQGLESVRGLLLNKMTEEERGLFDKKFDKTCMCVRG